MLGSLFYLIVKPIVWKWNDKAGTFPEYLTIQPEKSSKADMLSFLTLAILILLDPHQFVSCQRRSRNQEDYYRRRHRVPTIQEDCIKENANKTEELALEVAYNDEGEFGDPGKTIRLGPVGVGLGTGNVNCQELEKQL